MSLPASKNSRCYVCGPDNPFGLMVPFRREGPQGSQARYTARPEHGGWGGILHGGVTFALMDEALGWVLYYRDLPAVTARVEIRFHKPIAIGTKMVVKASVVKRRRRLFDAHAEIRTDGPEDTLLAEADATMCLIDKTCSGVETAVDEENGANVPA